MLATLNKPSLTLDNFDVLGRLIVLLDKVPGFVSAEPGSLLSGIIGSPSTEDEVHEHKQ